MSQAGSSGDEIVQKQHPFWRKTQTSGHGLRVRGPGEVVADGASADDGCCYAKTCGFQVPLRQDAALLYLLLEIVQQGFDARKFPRGLADAMHGLQDAAVLLEEDQRTFCAPNVACQDHSVSKVRETENRRQKSDQKRERPARQFRSCSMKQFSSMDHMHHDGSKTIHFKRLFGERVVRR